MNVLLDTHILLWCLYAPENLSEKARNIINDPDNWICFSNLSLWECAIKHKKQPDIFEFDASDVNSDCREAGFSPVTLQPRHIFTLNTLNAPKGIKHNDPFDRMLISQAKADTMIFLTHDHRLSAYGVNNVIYV